LVNLVERGMVSREGNVYAIEPEGVEHASTFGEGRSDKRREVAHVISAHNSDQREALRERLGGMHPYAFERLVRELLKAMGYEDATVTKWSGDKGVDVVATVQFGIISIREVVQVSATRAASVDPSWTNLEAPCPTTRR
jgi:restriction system protein